MVLVAEVVRCPPKTIDTMSYSRSHFQYMMLRILALNF